MTPEEMKDFVRSVSKMRSWQKAYEERRTTYARREAERFQAEVDRMLEKEKEDGR